MQTQKGKRSTSRPRHRERKRPEPQAHIRNLVDNVPVEPAEASYENSPHFQQIKALSEARRRERKWAREHHDAMKALRSTNPLAPHYHEVQRRAEYASEELINAREHLRLVMEGMISPVVVGQDLGAVNAVAPQPA